MVYTIIPAVAKSPVAPIARRRPSPRLRTKTGCFKCRERRKKCDEIKPICSGCSRNKLCCLWPGTSTQEKDPHRNPHPDREVVKASPSPSSPDIQFLEYTWEDWGISTLQSTKSRTLFEYFRTACAPLMLRQHVNPIYQASDWFVHGALQHESLMHALLACSAVHLSCIDERYRVAGIEYYSKSVSEMRGLIAEGTVKGDEDWLVMVLVFGYLVEIWFFDNPTSIKKQLFTALHLLQCRQIAFAKPDQDIIPDPLFERLLAESILGNISAISMLMPGITHDMDLDVVGRHLSLFRNDDDVKSSPVLGVSPKLYFFVVEVSRLCSQVSPEEEVVEEFAERFSEWESEEENRNDELDENFLLGVKLYVLAIEVLLLKLRGETGVMELANEAVGIVIRLGSFIEEALCMDYYTWPLLVIGCASKGQQDGEDVIRRKMDDVRRKTACGGVKLAVSLLGKVWKLETEEDGLEILLGIGREGRMRLKTQQHNEAGTNFDCV